MQLVLNEDQELIAKTALDFAAEKSPLARVRALRDDADATGFSPVRLPRSLSGISSPAHVLGLDHLEVVLLDAVKGHPRGDQDDYLALPGGSGVCEQREETAAPG